MVKARKYVLVKAFQGEPKRSDLQIVEEELPPLKDGEFLAKALYLSVDPYMRLYMSQYPVGSDMIGGQIAKVIESKNNNFTEGSLVFGSFGWRTHTLVKPNEINSFMRLYTLPDLGDLSPSLGLGVLGMPGNTAYFGFLELCQPKKGETVVVSGAAGAVGAIVGQIAKIKGCKVIGFAGSDDKCKWLQDIGFDLAFNYKKVNIKNALMEAAPKGVDCYFDNVGGELSTIVMNQMNRFGRISICGSISAYNSDPSQMEKMPIFQPLFVGKELKAEGFHVGRWADKNKWLEGINQNMQWMKEGKLKYVEHITEGFDHMYEAFVGMLRGENTGKAVVVVK